MAIRTKNGLRLLVAGMIISPMVALVGPNAHATVHEIGNICAPNATLVPRCVSLHYDDVNHRYRAHAGIFDMPGGPLYDVDVTAVAVNPGGSNAEVGFELGGADTLESPLVNCTQKRVGFRADFRWRNIVTLATDSDTLINAVDTC